MTRSFAVDPAFALDRPASKAGVLAAIAESQGIARAPAPAWLRDWQIDPFQRAVTAVRRFGGTMVAMAVGTGKTYLSLAIARAVADRAPTVVVPAILVPQWRRVAEAVGVAIEIASHESVSRGCAPHGRGPVIIDESHRFREPTSRRYQTIAPILVGRPTVLVTATPVVNRVGDLIAQLRLAVRDDALAHRGLASLGMIATPGAPTAALQELVIGLGDGPAGEQANQLPARQARRIAVDGEPTFTRVLAGLERLGCARDPGVAAMIRVGLLRALGSSPAALRGALGRYRRLLDHATQAHRAGQPVSRRAIFQAIGAEPEQLVLWELLPGFERQPVDLALGDRRGLGPLCRLVSRWSSRGDGKLGHLRALLRDRRPTIVFATSVETVQYLRDHLGQAGTAWITGSGAGIGPGRASRATLLAAFAPGDPAWPAEVPRPGLLLASDVAAEGLNLQGVNRIVHYDLPWTAVRLAQRDGRAIRMGSWHQSVEVVRFDLPEALEQRIAIERSIERKARLPATVGLDGAQAAGDPVSPEDCSSPVATPGWVELLSDQVGAFAAVTAQSVGLVLSRGGDGRWSRVDVGIDELLRRFQSAPEGASTSPSIEPILDSLTGPIADWLTELALALPLPPRARCRSAIRVARIRGAELWRARQGQELEQVGRVQRFLGRGHSAGEGSVARAVATGDPAAFARAARLAEGGAHSSEAMATLVGLVVFRPNPG